MANSLAGSGIQGISDVAASQITAPKLTGKLSGHGNIDKTAKDFESMFMSQMLQPMFAGMKVDPNFGGGHGEEVMRGFLVQEYGKMVSKTGKLGIATSVKNEMIQAQAKATTGNGGLNGIAQ